MENKNHRPRWARLFLISTAAEVLGVALLHGWLGDLIWWFANLFDTGSFVKRWNCGAWAPAHVYTDIAADLTIGVAYLGIPIAIGWFARNTWDHIPSRARWVPLAFVVFILLCGATHFASPAPFRWPMYRLFTTIKVATALASLPTMVALIPTVRAAAAIVRHAKANHEHRIELNRQLQAAVGELDRKNRSLQAHIAELVAKHERGSDEMDVPSEITKLRAMVDEVRRA